MSTLHGMCTGFGTEALEGRVLHLLAGHGKSVPVTLPPVLLTEIFVLIHVDAQLSLLFSRAIPQYPFIR
jgi:hypothetical protein